LTRVFASNLIIKEVSAPKHEINGNQRIRYLFQVIVKSEKLYYSDVLFPTYIFSSQLTALPGFNCQISLQYIVKPLGLACSLSNDLIYLGYECAKERCCTTEEKNTVGLPVAKIQKCGSIKYKCLSGGVNEILL